MKKSPDAKIATSVGLQKWAASSLWTKRSPSVMSGSVPPAGILNTWQHTHIKHDHQAGIQTYPSSKYSEHLANTYINMTTWQVLPTPGNTHTSNMTTRQVFWTSGNTHIKRTYLESTLNTWQHTHTSNMTTWQVLWTPGNAPSQTWPPGGYSEHLANTPSQTWPPGRYSEHLATHPHKHDHLAGTLNPWQTHTSNMTTWLVLWTPGNTPSQTWSPGRYSEHLANTYIKHDHLVKIIPRVVYTSNMIIWHSMTNTDTILKHITKWDSMPHLTHN